MMHCIDRIKRYQPVRLLVLIMIAFATLVSNAEPKDANQWQDPNGRYVIDLPDNAQWRWDSASVQPLDMFSDGKIHKILIFGYDSTNDIGSIFSDAINQTRAALPNASPTENIKEMTVNGNRTRFGIYEGTLQNIRLYAMMGAMALEEGGLWFWTVLSEKDAKKLLEPLKKSFFSIRRPDQAASGVANEVSLPDSAVLGLGKIDMQPVTGDSSVWVHEHVTLRLPPGWKEEPKSSSAEDVVIGTFGYEPMPGVTLIVMRHRGFLLDEKDVVKAARETVEGGIPNAKVVKKSEELLENGNTVKITRYRGSTVAQGMEVGLSAITCVSKVPRCWLTLVAIFSGDPAKEEHLEKQLLAITKSAK